MTMKQKAGTEMVNDVNVMCFEGLHSEPVCELAARSALHAQSNAFAASSPSAY
jgi:hypothetical protein